VVHPAFESIISKTREQSLLSDSVMTLSERRKKFRDDALEFQGELAPVARRVDVTVELDDRILNARLYEPENVESTALGIYFHGGSFVLGDLDTHEGLCRRLSFDTGLRMLAVDYRLAPEHPFPSALNDAIDVIRYVISHRGEFGSSDARLVVVGDSAGANLATVAVSLLRDYGLGIAAQVLLYPTLGPELVTNSAHQYGTGFLLNLDDLRHDYRQYLGEWADHTDPRITPLLCRDLVGVAPAIIVVAECDPLRDEGVAYAGLLSHFGVPVELLEGEGMVHGFLRMGGAVPEALAILDDLADHVHNFVELTNQ
jgi:acetyl esterase